MRPYNRSHQPKPAGKKRRAHLNRATRYHLWLRDGARCHYCNAEITFAEMTADHVVPVAHGGTDDVTNLTTACAPCNNAKATLDYRTFRYG